jgi:hypothetical protein
MTSKAIKPPRKFCTGWSQPLQKFNRFLTFGYYRCSISEHGGAVFLAEDSGMCEA